MTFRVLADATNDAFARWDRPHLHASELADGTRIGIQTPKDDPDEDGFDDEREKLSRLWSGERFAFEFDPGDSWWRSRARARSAGPGPAARRRGGAGGSTDPLLGEVVRSGALVVLAEAGLRAATGRD